MHKYVVLLVRPILRPIVARAQADPLTEHIDHVRGGGWRSGQKCNPSVYCVGLPTPSAEFQSGRADLNHILVAVPGSVGGNVGWTAATFPKGTVGKHISGKSDRLGFDSALCTRGRVYGRFSRTRRVTD